jgi:hypothetical protein
MPYNQIDATGNIAPGTDPIGPSSKQIRQIIHNALNQGGYTFTWSSQNTQPCHGTFNNGVTSIDVYIYASRIGNGGRANLVNEKRIQIQQTVNNVGFLRPLTATQKTILVGIYDCPTGTPIFAAWDATSNARHTQKSCQVNVHDLQNGLLNGIFSTTDSHNNPIYTFTPDYLGQYIDLVQTGNTVTIQGATTIPLATRVRNATQGHRASGTIRTTKQLLASLGRLTTTEKDAVVKQRVGQGLFKELLKAKYGCKCMLCNITTESMLVASHIKKWSDCSNDTERLDYNNGLLLCPHHDALFDKHLITFDEHNGTLIVSPTLSATEQTALNTASIPSITITPQMSPYMADHHSQLKK